MKMRLRHPHFFRGDIYIYIYIIMFWGGLKNVTVSEPPVWTIRHCSKLKPPKRGKKEKGVPMEVKTGKKIPHTHSYYHISPPLQKEANPVQQLKAKSPVNFHRIYIYIYNK
jgi:hypothetical protein